MENIDDDFPNRIQIPNVGVMRLGKSIENDDPVFTGGYTCLQVFDVFLTSNDVETINDNCFPSSWPSQPNGDIFCFLVANINKIANIVFNVLSTAT